MAGSTNPADIFTKEDNDVKHFETLQDQMVASWEEFAQSSILTHTLNNNIQTIDSNPDILWGVLERELEDQDSEELIPRINSKELTPLIKSKSMTQHKYKDPKSRSKIEVACE